MEHEFNSFRVWLNNNYPRPHLCRTQWTSLNGEWSFREDSHDQGITEHWFATPTLVGSATLATSASAHEAGSVQTIQVPFPPGSALAGLRDFQDADVVWYARNITASDLATAGWGSNERCILHFEGVDYHAQVWLNGHLVAEHEGGFTPFHSDITAYLRSEDNFVVVRACDRKADVAQPRGKQDWRERPHGIWYQRTTGIWRDVWIEAVPQTYIEELRCVTNVDARQMECQLRFNDEAPPGSTVTMTIAFDGDGVNSIAHSVTAVCGRDARLLVDLPQLANPHEGERYLWSPESPRLFDARIELHSGGRVAPHCADGESSTSEKRTRDTVVSYFGLASVATTSHLLTLNDHPVYVRGVLDQGYWAESYLTPPSPRALRFDLELAKSLGFNTLRAHQRTPDARYLAWADVVGLMIWVEFPAAYEYSPQSFVRTMDEWTQTVRRCAHHPSVSAWVPVNESWGVPQVARSAQQQAALRALVAATRALDPTRPVIGNDGWHQLDTDLVTLHDYASDPQALAVAYCDEAAMRASLYGDGPQGRAILLEETWQADKPVIVSEFGGVSLSDDEESWGYSQVQDSTAFLRALRGLFDALYASPIIGGWCYTQLTDTGQETNGLCYADRTLKAPLSELRKIICGGEAFFAQQVRPRRITEAWRGGEDDD